MQREVPARREQKAVARRKREPIGLCKRDYCLSSTVEHTVAEIDLACEGVARFDRLAEDRFALRPFDQPEFGSAVEGRLVPTENGCRLSLQLAALKLNPKELWGVAIAVPLIVLSTGWLFALGFAAFAGVLAFVRFRRSHQRLATLTELVESSSSTRRLALESPGFRCSPSCASSAIRGSSSDRVRSSKRGNKQRRG
jgi:hypothetical protein